MKLAFYSGGNSKQNHELNKRISDILDKKTSIAIIPSRFAGFEAKYKPAVIELLSPIGFTNFPTIPADSNSMSFEERCSILNEVDCVYLSGGLVQSFLFHLQKSKLLYELRRLVLAGKPLIGLSAGAMIMTNDIELAFLDYDPEPKFIELEDYKGMGLVDFAFWPHYEKDSELDKQLLEFTKARKQRVIACPEGAGVVVNGSEIFEVGNVNWFVDVIMSN